MRFIYVDESGVSAKEPVSVVVGLIVHADNHILKVEDAIKQLILKHVPEKYRPGFVFHATDLWSSPKLREGWDKDSRLNFICEMASIPRKMQLPVTWSICRRGQIGPFHPSYDLTPAQQDHYMAFFGCIIEADTFLFNYAPSEVATIIAEDIPEKKKFFSQVPKIMRYMAVQHPDMAHPEAGMRIRPCIHFAEKDADPIVWIADACAFCLRRFLTQPEQSSEFIMALANQVLPISDYDASVKHGLLANLSWF